jgi:hypothetical protein
VFVRGSWVSRGVRFGAALSPLLSKSAENELSELVRNRRIKQILKTWVLKNRKVEMRGIVAFPAVVGRSRSPLCKDRHCELTNGLEVGHSLGPKITLFRWEKADM